jgi:hypothetical protein
MTMSYRQELAVIAFAAVWLLLFVVLRFHLL